MMKKVAAAAVAASGLILAGAGVAAADQGTHAVAGGSGIGSGNVINVPVNVPVQVVGNTVTVLGSMNSATAYAAPGN